MTCSSVCREMRDDKVVCGIVTAGIFVFLGAITMLVCGILGASSVLSIPPGGYGVMIPLSIVIIGIMVWGTKKILE